MKVLDFGLAKALEPTAARVDATAFPTITSPASGPQLGRRDAIEARAGLLAECLNDLRIAADGGSGVVATYELVAQMLQ